MTEPRAVWPPKRILLGSDFSSAAEAAHAVSRSIARRTGAELHLLHASQDPSRLLTGYEVLDRVLEYTTGQRPSAEEISSRVHKPNDPDPEVHVCVGDPASQLVVFRDRLEVQLLVLGASGLRGFRRHLLGSVADRMLREPGCPLLLVNRRPPAGEFKRILVALELPDVPTPALEMGVRMAHDLRGELILLHVLPPRGYISDRRHVELHPETATERMRAAAASVDPTIPVQAVARQGDPVELIREAAHEFETELVVMGAERNPDGFPGPVVDHVVRAGLDAVLLIWPEQEEPA